MTRMELMTALDAIHRVRVAVMGDFCLDAYWVLDNSRSEISVETGLPTRPIREQRYTLGGAGNVATNLHALGVRTIRVFGVVGEDPFAREMHRRLTAMGTDTAGLLTQSDGWVTHVYIKPHIEGQEESRLDFGNFNKLTDDTVRTLLARVRECLPEVDVMVLNEQVSTGIHASPDLRDGINTLMREYPDRVFLLDSRHYHDCYECAVRKMNDRETMRLCGTNPAAGVAIPRGDVLQAADRLFQRWGKPVFVTRGPQGCLVRDERGVREIPGVQISGRTDPVGAGDTFLAAVAAAIGAGLDNTVAAELGNLAAAVVVQKCFQTGTATPAEILGSVTRS